jgi:ABC-type uncharacterized transport system auxiliary subunit
MKALVAAVLLALLLTGCSSAPDRKYYGLAYSLAESQTYPTPRYPVTLRVQEPDVRLAYDRPQIVYRYDPYNFRYYHYRFWVAKPQSMVAELVFQHLKHMNLFKDVSLTYTAGIPDYELAGQIDALEEYDSGDTWYAHLSMSFRLVRFDDRQVIFTWRFDEKKEVFTKDPRPRGARAVRAFGQADAAHDARH